MQLIAALPPELQGLDEAHIQAYREASKGGTVTVHQSRVMLVGHSGAGKTSLKSCLLDEPFESKHISTTGIHCDPAHMKVEVCKARNWQAFLSKSFILI